MEFKIIQNKNKRNHINIADIKKIIIKKFTQRSIGVFLVKFS